jgi:PilZ domain
MATRVSDGEDRAAASDEPGRRWRDTATADRRESRRAERHGTVGRNGQERRDGCRDRRAAPRYDAQTLGGPVVCRVNPGQEVQLTDLSSVGARVESMAALLPGRLLQLHIHRRSWRTAVQTKVVWCAVIAIIPGRGVRYVAGLAFARWVDVPAALTAIGRGDFGQV